VIRLLHIIAISVLIASAGYAYSIKYDTLYYSEQVAKLKSKVQREREAIAVLQAEWQYLDRPDRLQEAADKHLDLQALKIQQLARLSDLPNRPARTKSAASSKPSAFLGPRQRRRIRPPTSAPRRPKPRNGEPRVARDQNRIAG
jgi:hypothetical protein